MFNLQQKDPNIFVGTVEGSPTIEDIQDMLLKEQDKKSISYAFYVCCRGSCQE